MLCHPGDDPQEQRLGVFKGSSIQCVLGALTDAMLWPGDCRGELLGNNRFGAVNALPRTGGFLRLELQGAASLRGHTFLVPCDWHLQVEDSPVAYSSRAVIETGKSGVILQGCRSRAESGVERVADRVRRATSGSEIDGRRVSRRKRATRQPPQSFFGCRRSLSVSLAGA